MRLHRQPQPRPLTRHLSGHLSGLHRLALTTSLAAATLLGGGASQAAGLGIASGSVTGGLVFQADANGQLLANGASLVDASGLNFLLGNGRLESRSNGPGKPIIDQLWSASTSLDARDAALLQFTSGASSTLGLSGSGQFGGGTERSNLLLEAELAVNSTGEAAGTPVRLVISGNATSQFSSSGPVLDVQPSFDLVVRDAQSNILASWQGLAAGSNSASFRISLDTRVGDSLWFSLSHDSTSLLGDAASLAAAGDSLAASAQLTGTVQVSAVPEPETCALFLVGLATVGLLRQRRGRQTGQLRG